MCTNLVHNSVKRIITNYVIGVSIVVLAHLFCTETSFAAERLSKTPESTEDGWKLCKAIDKNINMLAPRTRIVDWPEKLHFVGYTKVIWERVDPAAEMDLVKRGYLEEFDFSGKKTQLEKDIYWNNRRSLVLFKIKNGIIRMYSAVVDLDGDGKQTIIYRLVKPILEFGTIQHYHIGNLSYSDWIYIVHQTEIDPLVHDEIVQLSQSNNLSAFNYNGKTWFISAEGYSILSSFFITRMHKVLFFSECSFNFEN